MNDVVRLMIQQLGTWPNFVAEFRASTARRRTIEKYLARLGYSGPKIWSNSTPVKEHFMKKFGLKSAQVLVKPESSHDECELKELRKPESSHDECELAERNWASGPSPGRMPSSLPTFQQLPKKFSGFQPSPSAVVELLPGQLLKMAQGLFHVDAIGVDVGGQFTLHMRRAANPGHLPEAPASQPLSAQSDFHPKETIMTKFVTRKTFVSIAGRQTDLASLNKADVYRFISEKEAEVKKLNEIQNKPAMLVDDIKELETDIATLVDLVNERYAAKKAADAANLAAPVVPDAGNHD